MSKIIELKKINKYYGEKERRFHALKNINLEVEEGDFLVIIGKSGSGKSSLLNILALLDSFDNGEYKFKNTSVKNLDEKNKAQIRNKNIGFIFQQFHLIKMLNIKQNIEIPLLYNKKIDKDEREERIKYILGKYELSDKLYRYPNELSGGQQQRIAIARALINDPNIILADEPTGALDLKTGRIVMEDLRNLNKSGKTIVMITHDMDLTKYANKVIKISDGEIED